jgi:plasmid stabilization system protein ParE
VIVTFDRRATRETTDAVLYYNAEQTDLSREFLADVRRTVDAIVEYPRAGPIVRGTIRRRLCAHFPYALLYRAHADRIRIVAVMHAKRRPDYWSGRR